MDEVACSVAVAYVLHTSQCEMVHISVMQRKHRTQARTRATDHEVFPVWPMSAQYHKSPHTVSQCSTNPLGSKCSNT